METKAISLTFFLPKNLNTHMRFWDVYNSLDRYWFNIPSSIALNSVFYPDFKIKIHVSKEVETHPLFEVIQKISENFDNVQIDLVDLEFTNTEPTMWRYKPLFDKEFDLVLCRDIDSIPTSDEIRATHFFVNNPNFYLHTLRTHTNHTTIPTILLAGLCGFRPKQIPFIQGFDFNIYYNHFKSSNWGLDQNSLINIFASNQDWTNKYFLDSPISTNTHKVGNPLIPCVSYDQDFYKSNVKFEYPKELIDFLDEETKWAGEPTDIRGDKLRKLLSFTDKSFSKMKDVLNSCSEKVRDFYLDHE